MKVQASSRIATAVAIVGCSVIGFATAHHANGVVFCVLAVAAIFLCLYVPLRYLPLIALAATLLLPTQSLPLPTNLVGFPVGLLPFVIWRLRGPLGRYEWPIGKIIGSLLCFALLGSFLLGPVHEHKGALWLVTALVTVGTIGFAVRGRADVRQLEQFFLSLTVALACLAVVEALLLHSNPIYGSLYQRAQTPLLQHWSVYRATTLMGHPLINATVFAAAAVLALTKILANDERAAISWSRLVILCAGLAATGSRGGVLAVLVGAVFVLLTYRGGLDISLRKGVVLVACLIAALGFASLLASRNDSREGRRSAADRQSVISQTREALKDAPIFGVGPTGADAWRAQRDLADAVVPIENSYANLLVSVGWPGLVLFVALMLSVFGVALTVRDAVPSAGALLAILVAIGGYNAIVTPSILVLIGLFMTLALGHGQGSRYVRPRQHVATAPKPVATVRAANP